jgi:hypothetical protein
MVQVLLVALNTVVVNSSAGLRLFVLAFGLFVDHLGLGVREGLFLTRVEIDDLHGFAGSTSARL